MRHSAAFALLVVALWLPSPGGSIGAQPGADGGDTTLDLRVLAPASLEPDAVKVRAIDRAALGDALTRAGLPVPRAIEVHLIPESDRRARQVEPWVVGRAFGDRLVWIFPQRVTTYPYDSTESVVRHEVAHLALSAQAANRPLPRWFHEGVAVSVDAGWGLRDSARLLLTAADRSGISDLEQLFRSVRQADTTEAYLLAAALINDLRLQHGDPLPGAIARRVADGAPFDRAFAAETGETPDQAAARAWEGYRRWSRWLPLITDPAAVWTFILLLSFAAFFARILQRIRQRRLWTQEEKTDDWGLANDDWRNDD